MSPTRAEWVDPYGDDLYSEPEGDARTLEHLGPLAPLAGLWEGVSGHDEHPVARGARADAFIERYELAPIDRQTNGPQLFYGLRYHTRVVRPGEVETFHDQVGYWLWEPDAKWVTFSLSIPRGQSVLAGGPAEPDATEFEVSAERGSATYGIVSHPFLDRAFRTVRFTMRVSIGADDAWSYEETATLEIPGDRAPFEHRDRNVLRRLAAPSLNPMAAALT